MSNHVHMIISAEETGKINLSGIIRDLKKFTSQNILSTIRKEKESRKDWMLDKFTFAASNNKRNGKNQFWIQNNHAVELVTAKFQTQNLDYIHENPVTQGWVNSPEHYRYSSAIDYYGGKGLIKIKFL